MTNNTEYVGMVGVQRVWLVRQTDILTQSRLELDRQCVCVCVNI